jgi:hypothetical protein
VSLTKRTNRVAGSPCNRSRGLTRNRGTSTKTLPKSRYAQGARLSCFPLSPSLFLPLPPDVDSTLPDSSTCDHFLSFSLPAPPSLLFSSPPPLLSHVGGPSLSPSTKVLGSWVDFQTRRWSRRDAGNGAICFYVAPSARHGAAFQLVTFRRTRDVLFLR